MTKRVAAKATGNSWAGLGGPRSKPRKATRRAPSFDWFALERRVQSELMPEPVIERPATGDEYVRVWWDGLYNHAIQRALEGRKPEELLELLDNGRPLHPCLGPPLAEYIRTLIRAPQGPARVMTAREDLMVRHFVDKAPDAETRVATIAWLREIRGWSEYLIEQSLERTKPKK